MYLKSLVLKGFKSFADRSVLTLEPGIIAVVGPNGSGKSNISDAVLWVLGERSARNLRGEAMEDVVFAGSSARKATGLAEVDLVLDNADGTLPVDFREVAITRRMYRSGESEYLINGTPARRMDVLDILHDSGLGAGTHSIISQGSLDSILQSSPEERRALIEEAAGVLKHKQRKAKSERRLQQMDIHLDRARDIAREVERQLAPLARKAKRARDHEQLAAELGELTLALAVDDLRTLQGEWEKASEEERALSQALEERRAGVAQAEAQVGRLQEQVRQENADAGELARMHGRAATAIERLDGAVRLLREKQRSAADAEADARIKAESGAARHREIAGELEKAVAQLDEAKTKRAEADARLAALLKEQAVNAERRRSLEDEAHDAERERRQTERDVEEARRRLAETQEALAAGLAHMKLVEGHGKELEAQLQSAQDDSERLAAAAASAEERRVAAARADAEARSEVAASVAARDAAQREAAAAREAVSAISAKVQGLEEVERAVNATNPARAWVHDNLGGLSGSPAPLSHVVRVEEGLDMLVESLLGQDIAAVLIDDPNAALETARAVSENGLAGEVSLIVREDAARAARTARDAAAACGGWPLIDRISCPPEAQQAVSSLLGDVVVCESAPAAVAAHATCGESVRFATEQGCIVWPQGKVTVWSSEAEPTAGVLAQVRRLEESREALEAARERDGRAADALAAAENRLRAAQTESLKRAQALAELRGVEESARADAKHAEEKAASVRREYEGVQRQREEAAKAVSEARPSVEALEKRLAELAEQSERLRAATEAAEEAVIPLRKEAARLRDAVGETRLESARLAEREAYTLRLVGARKDDQEKLNAEMAEAARIARRKEVAQRRVAPLISCLRELTDALRVRIAGVEDAMSAAQDSASGLHGRMGAAREAARKAHDAFDECSARLSEARVGKGRLEVQVEAAVNTVVKDCGTPLDHALGLPALADRAEVEGQALKLRRRISKMGAVDPGAAEEYERVKARHDYLSVQLSDLEDARRSLTKIIRIIDERMRDDFVSTYEEVNRNFQEIFATLFPGGSAHLALVGADGPEAGGVEVSAQPRGKRITKMTLMSGGEKSLTALALLFAVYRTRATPFYILDEVEAALDDSNLRRLTAYLEKLRGDTQLIMITHQRRTMEMADLLFGVSMQADGVTKVISQRLDQALRHAE